MTLTGFGSFEKVHRSAGWCATRALGNFFGQGPRLDEPRFGSIDRSRCLDGFHKMSPLSGGRDAYLTATAVGDAFSDGYATLTSSVRERMPSLR